MNRNFTSTGKRIVVILNSTSPKVVVTALAIFFSSLSAISARNMVLPHLQAAPVFTTFNVDGELNNAASLSISLNSSHSQATVNLNNLPFYNNTLSVIDMIGTTVMSMPALNGSSIKLDINNLKAGIYIVKIMAADGSVAKEKMILINR